jgi:mannose-6-phosphate isomerase-like protein (cupin superfamily)
MERISIAEKFARFAEQWQPKIVAELNGQEVKLVKVQGTFPWHHHDDVDEMFLVWRGRSRVETGPLSWGRANWSSSRAVSSIALPPMKRPK